MKFKAFVAALPLSGAVFQHLLAAVASVAGPSPPHHLITIRATRIVGLAHDAFAYGRQPFNNTAPCGGSAGGHCAAFHATALYTL